MLKPLGDRILIKPIKNAEETASGLVLVEHRKPETMGEVVAVGFCTHPLKAEADEAISDLGVEAEVSIPSTAEWYASLASLIQRATARDPLVKPGDTVIFSWTAGQDITLDDDERYLLMKESDILAVLEPERV